MPTSFPAPVWIITSVGLLVVVVVDLLVVSRRSRTLTIREATRWVLLYVSLAAAFGAGLILWGPPGTGSQFFAGYVTEYSLSVDNLFVFVIIMARFAVPDEAKDKTLYIGIILSFVLRAIFIVAGVAAITAATAAFFVFGALLVYTGVRLLFQGENDDADFREGWVLTRLRRILPLSKEYEGDRILVRREGRRMATPLALTIAAIAVANVVFALDSIPAILGLTQDTYIILTANAFALIGLRQLFFVIGGLLDRLTYLNIGLALILCFVGLKLVDEGFRGAHQYHMGSVPIPEISTQASLGFIVGVLAITAVASLIRSSTTRGDVV